MAWKRQAVRIRSGPPTFARLMMRLWSAGTFACRLFYLRDYLRSVPSIVSTAVERRTAVYTIYMWHFVYVLQNHKKNQYVGQSESLGRRLVEHNLGNVSATIDGRPWHIAWFCGFRSKKEALVFERYLKGGSGTIFRYRHLVSK